MWLGALTSPTATDLACTIADDAPTVFDFRLSFKLDERGASPCGSSGRRPCRDIRPSNYDSTIRAESLPEAHVGSRWLMVAVSTSINFCSVGNTDPRRLICARGRRSRERDELARICGGNHRGGNRRAKSLDTSRADSYSKWCGRLPLAAGSRPSLDRRSRQ